MIVTNGQEHAFAVFSKLTSLYIQFNDFGSSVSVLKAMEEPQTFLWNSVIKAHVNSGLIESAFLVFKLMRQMGVSCDGYTFPIVSKVAVQMGFECGVSFAEMIHCTAVKMGFGCNVYFCNAAIDAYVKNGSFGDALKLFDEMPSRDLVSWTSMISGYVHEGNIRESVQLFNEMRNEVGPNEVTLIVMLQTCSNVVEGRQFHGYSIKCGSSMDRSLRNSIMQMYADFSSADEAETLFRETDKRDAVSWNIMIYWHSSKGNAKKIVDCFNKMRKEVEASVETYTILIMGLGECGDHSQCRQIHCLALKSGSLDDILITTFLNSYAKCGDFENSTKFFKEVFCKSYATCDDAMIETMRSLVVGYTNVGALRLGKSIHGYFIRNSLSTPNESARLLDTSILNMYVKCGDISSGRICFDRMPVKDLVSWSSMIEGYSTHGLGHEALQIFHQMKTEGIKPNGVTFLSLLSACSHSGLLQEGCETLISMKRVFGIEPDLDHYTSIVDLLGRYGKVKEALSVVLKFVASPDSRIWGALLGAARIHEDRKVGEFSARKILELERDNARYYTLISNVQAIGERWSEVEETRDCVKEMNVIKNPGWSFLEVKGVVHGFVSGDRSHHQIEDFYNLIWCLSRNSLDF
ncbi:hypothetical protein ACP275_10G164800 [Erythranthe tilingii]